MGLLNEEAPSSDDAKWAECVREGTRLLHQLTDLRHEVEKRNVKKAKGTITKMINKQKEEIVDEILDRAERLKCTSGKVRLGLGTLRWCEISEAL